MSTGYAKNNKTWEITHRVVEQRAIFFQDGGDPLGAPILTNLPRYQALAVKFTAARLVPCIFGKLGACKIQVIHAPTGLPWLE